MREEVYRTGDLKSTNRKLIFPTGKSVSHPPGGESVIRRAGIGDDGDEADRQIDKRFRSVRRIGVEE